LSSDSTPISIPYDAALEGLGDGDILLCRRRPGPDLVGRFISTAGRSPYVHAAMFAWWNGTPFALESRQFRGIRAIHLPEFLAQYPGRCDWFAANAGGRWPSFNRMGAVEHMKRLTGRPYGYLNVLAAGLLHAPLIRFFARPDYSNGGTASKRPPFCSQAVAEATRLGGGVDLVTQLPDHLTEPGDLARSQFYEYRGTFLNQETDQ